MSFRPNPVAFYGVDISDRLEELFDDQMLSQIFSDENIDKNVFKVPNFEVEVVQYGHAEDARHALVCIGDKAEEHLLNSLIALPTWRHLNSDLSMLCKKLKIKYEPVAYAGVYVC